jgi:hypothetical protein
VTPADWLTDAQVIEALGISKRTLNALLSQAPATAPKAYVHTGVGVRCPRRRWRPDLVWSWLEAVQSHVAGTKIVRKPATVAPKPRPRAPSPESAKQPSLRQRVLARQKADL